MPQDLTLDTIDIVSPDHYQQNGYPHAEWTLLRREAPVYWFDRGRGCSLSGPSRSMKTSWSFIGKRPDQLINKPRQAVFIPIRRRPPRRTKPPFDRRTL